MRHATDVVMFLCAVAMFVFLVTISVALIGGMIGWWAL